MLRAKEIGSDRVAIYIRWSTDDQSEGTTLEIQGEACRAYVVSQGWQVRDDLIFVDDGYSGGSLKRPGLNRLRQLVKDGQVDCVVVFKLDRLSRSVVDTVGLVLREWEGRTHLKSAREAVDTTTALGKQIFYLLVSYAEWERNVIRERTQAGKMRRFQEGSNPGIRFPYGYTRGETRGSFAVVEHEASVIRRIYDMYLTGLGYKAITNALNEGGITFRGGRPFNHNTVKEILSNRLYVGEIVYRKRVVNPERQVDEKAPRQVRNSQGPLVVKSPAPTIIPMEQWERAAALRSRRYQERVPNRSLSSDHLLTGIVRCQKCGHTMIGRKADPDPETPSRLRRQYYMCGGQRLQGKAFCDCGYIRQPELDAWIVDRLKARYGGQLGRQNYLADLEAEQQRELAQVQASLDQLRAEDGALDREMEVISRDYRREGLTLEEFREQRSQVLRTKAALADQLQVAERRLAELNRRLAARQSMADLVDQVAMWDTLSQGEKKHLLRELIADLRVYKPSRGEDVIYELAWVGSAQAETSHT